MVPLLLVAYTPSEFESYISNLIKNEQIKPYNVFHLTPAKSELSLDEIKDMKRELVTSTGEKRLMVVDSFDTATLEAQNSLLKTLEEKVEEILFVFCVSNPERVLSTIRSRSKTIYVTKHNNKRASESAEAFIDEILSAKSYIFLSSPLIAGIDKEEAGVLLDDISQVLRAKLSGSQAGEAAESLKMLLQMRSKIRDNNFNVQLALDYLLIFIHKTFTMKSRQ